MSDHEPKRAYALESDPLHGKENGRSHRVLRHPFSGRNVMAVGGGKGGVGKSFITANLAIKLTRLGRRVLLVDADLDAANLHTIFSMTSSRGTISNFLKGHRTCLEDVITRTPVPNLDLIAGSKDPLDAADVNKSSIHRLRGAFDGQDYDFVLMDVGPGTSSTMIELFCSAGAGIVVTSPDPTAIENTYRFLKCVFLNRMRAVMNAKENELLRGNLQRIFGEGWTVRVKTFGDIFSELASIDPSQAKSLRAAIERNMTFLMINKTTCDEDHDLGNLMRRASRDYFDVDIGFLGSIAYDQKVAESIRNKRPLSVFNAASPASASMDACLDRLLRSLKGTAKRQA